MYHGDINLGDTIDIKFCTVSTTGAPTVLAGTPVVSAYVGNGVVQITAGVTLTVDFDAVVGLNNVRVVATGANGFATATNVQLVITTGTVGGTSVVGYVIGSFSIEARSALRPTTAARTLDVSAGGEAGLDWANIGSPTTAQALTGTTVDLIADAVDAAAIATGAIDADAIADNAIDAGAIAADAITAAKIADSAIDRATFAVDTGLRTSRSNTAAAGAASTITLDAAASAVDDFYNDMIVYLTGGTGVGQARLITDYVGLTQVASVAPNWATTPDATSTFALLAMGRVDLGQWVDVAPSALIAGRVDANTQAMAANVITSSIIATDAIGAAQIAAGAITSSEAPNLDAAISTRATPAQVNTEVLDVLNTDTFAEPGQETPGTTVTLVTKLGYLYKAWRNRSTQTSTQYSLYNDDATTLAQKATVSDDATTFDKGEVATGP